jgi:hypothetical protein
MSKGGDKRGQRAHVRQSVRDGESVGEACCPPGRSARSGTETRSRRLSACTPRRPKT